MNVKTNVVIICFNALEYTRATLASLFEKTKSDYILTIVNNGSREDTREFLNNLVVPSNCKEYILIDNPENMGSSYANNQAFAVSLDKRVLYTCFCNNDLYFSNNWLTMLEECLDNNSKIAMVNPLRPSTRVLYDYDMSTMMKLSQLEETSDYKKELEDYTGMSISDFDIFCKKIVAVNSENSLNAIEIIKFPDALSTCVCLVNNKYIAKLEHFADPIFKRYGGEDIDTSWRVMEAGYDCAIAKNVYVHHFRGKSLKSNNLDRRALISASNQKLYEKWKNDINSLLIKQELDGVDIEAKLLYDTDNFWLLSQLNKGIDLIANLRERASV